MLFELCKIIDTIVQVKLATLKIILTVCELKMVVGVRSLFGLLLDGLKSGGLLLSGELLLVGSEPLDLVAGPSSPGSVWPPASLRLLPGLLRSPTGVWIVRVILIPLPLVGLHHPLPLHRVRRAHRQWLGDDLPGLQLTLHVSCGDLRGLDGHHAVVVIIGVFTVITFAVTGVITTSDVSGEGKKFGLEWIGGNFVENLLDTFLNSLHGSSGSWYKHWHWEGEGDRNRHGVGGVIHLDRGGEMNGYWDGHRDWLSESFCLCLLVAGVGFAGNAL